MLRKKQALKLNLGSGSNKLVGYINIDVEPACKPDMIVNFVLDKLPFKDDTVDEVVMFHCIEHIRKRFHPFILSEIQRVLKPAARVIFSYPEFLRCVENWKTNYRGKRSFWEATIYGRQSYPSDFHVALMDTEEFTRILRASGFKQVLACPELTEPFNTMLTAVKGTRRMAYEDLIKKDMESLRVRVA